jgi:hypothetical protein
LHDNTTRSPLPHGFKTDPKRRHIVSSMKMRPTLTVRCRRNSVRSSPT